MEGGAVGVDEIISQARDSITVKRVFGEPIEKDQLTIIPVAKVIGGAGGDRHQSRGNRWRGEPVAASASPRARRDLRDPR